MKKLLLLVIMISHLHASDRGEFFICSNPASLIRAVECANLDRLEDFLGGSPQQVYTELTKTDSSGETALIKAVREGKFDIVDALVQAVARLDKQQQYDILSYAPYNGYTALIEAVDTLEYSEHQDDRIVRALVGLLQQLDPEQKSSILSQQTRQGKTAVSIAREKGYGAIVALLE